jgi:hypothetical protein
MERRKKLEDYRYNKVYTRPILMKITSTQHYLMENACSDFFCHRARNGGNSQGKPYNKIGKV